MYLFIYYFAVIYFNTTTTTHRWNEKIIEQDLEALYLTFFKIFSSNWWFLDCTIIPIWNDNISTIEKLFKCYNIKDINIYREKDIVNISIEKILQNTHNGIESKIQKCVLGGTFDHLHEGHKILITLGALQCKEIYIGIAIDKLLDSKEYSKILQSYTIRKQNTLWLLYLIHPTIKVIIEPLKDSYGPTISDHFDLLLASAETKKTIYAINELRCKNNLEPLPYHLINLVGTVRGVYCI